ncbi:MAG TPA: HD domain-containing protein, partial [Verrucomicrobiae bacterium]|nr:HD domain-containing protein [Verrucomicrobiae bacterium]
MLKQWASDLDSLRESYASMGEGLVDTLKKMGVAIDLEGAAEEEIPARIQAAVRTFLSSESAAAEALVRFILEAESVTDDELHGISHAEIAAWLLHGTKAADAGERVSALLSELAAAPDSLDLWKEIGRAVRTKGFQLDPAQATALLAAFQSMNIPALDKEARPRTDPEVSRHAAKMAVFQSKVNATAQMSVRPKALMQIGEVLSKALIAGLAKEDLGRILGAWAGGILGTVSSGKSVEPHFRAPEAEGVLGGMPAFTSILTDHNRAKAFFEVLSTLRVVLGEKKTEQNNFEIPLGGNLSVRVDTGSYRRFIVIERDGAGKATAVQIKIPGELKQKLEVHDGDYTVSEAFRGLPGLEGRYQRTLLALDYDHDIYGLYGMRWDSSQEDFPFRVVISSYDLSRHATTSRLNEYVSAHKGEVEPAIAENIARQVSELAFGGVVANGWTGGRDLVHLQNFEITENPDGSVTVVLTNDFGDFKQIKSTEDLASVETTYFRLQEALREMNPAAETDQILSEAARAADEKLSAVKQAIHPEAKPELRTEAEEPEAGKAVTEAEAVAKNTAEFKDFLLKLRIVKPEEMDWIDLRVESPIPESIKDEFFFRTNLVPEMLSNAIRSTRLGYRLNGGRALPAEKKINFLVKIENGRMILEATDHSYGIPEDRLKVLGKQPVESTLGGGGFGMLMLTNMIQQKGGTFEIKSRFTENAVEEGLAPVPDANSFTTLKAVVPLDKMGYIKPAADQAKSELRTEEEKLKGDKPVEKLVPRDESAVPEAPLEDYTGHNAFHQLTAPVNEYKQPAPAPAPAVKRTSFRIPARLTRILTAGLLGTVLLTTLSSFNFPVRPFREQSLQEKMKHRRGYENISAIAADLRGPLIRDLYHDFYRQNPDRHEFMPRNYDEYLKALTEYEADFPGLSGNLKDAFDTGLDIIRKENPAEYETFRALFPNFNGIIVVEKLPHGRMAEMHPQYGLMLVTEDFLGDAYFKAKDERRDAMETRLILSSLLMHEMKHLANGQSRFFEEIPGDESVHAMDEESAYYLQTRISMDDTAAAPLTLLREYLFSAHIKDAYYQGYFARLAINHEDAINDHSIAAKKPEEVQAYLSHKMMNMVDLALNAHKAGVKIEFLAVHPAGYGQTKLWNMEVLEDGKPVRYWVPMKYDAGNKAVLQRMQGTVKGTQYQESKYFEGLEYLREPEARFVIAPPVERPSTRQLAAQRAVALPDVRRQKVDDRGKAIMDGLIRDVEAGGKRFQRPELRTGPSAAAPAFDARVEAERNVLWNAQRGFTSSDPGVIVDTYIALQEGLFRLYEKSLPKLLEHPKSGPLVKALAERTLNDVTSILTSLGEAEGTDSYLVWAPIREKIQAGTALDAADVEVIRQALTRTDNNPIDGYFRALDDFAMELHLESWLSPTDDKSSFYSKGPFQDTAQGTYERFALPLEGLEAALPRMGRAGNLTGKSLIFNNGDYAFHDLIYYLTGPEGKSHALVVSPHLSARNKELLQGLADRGQVLAAPAPDFSNAAKADIVIVTDEDLPALAQALRGDPGFLADKTLVVHSRERTEAGEEVMKLAQERGMKRYEVHELGQSLVSPLGMPREAALLNLDPGDTLGSNLAFVRTFGGFMDSHAFLEALLRVQDITELPPASSLPEGFQAHSFGDVDAAIDNLTEQFLGLMAKIERLEASVPAGYVMPPDVQAKFEAAKAEAGRATSELQTTRFFAHTRAFNPATELASASARVRPLQRLLAHLNLRIAQDFPSFRARLEEEVTEGHAAASAPVADKTGALPQTTVVTNSAMAGIRTLKDVVQRMSGKGMLIGKNAYYETGFLVDAEVTPFPRAERVDERDIAGMIEKVLEGKHDALFLEPLANAISKPSEAAVLKAQGKEKSDFPAFDLQAILREFSNVQFKEPFFLILDVAVFGPAFRLSDYLKDVQLPKNLNLVLVRSSQKLDQQGQEMASLGVLNIISSKGTDQQALLARILQSREQGGAYPSVMQLAYLASLDYNLDEGTARTRLIHRNTAEVARFVQTLKNKEDVKKQGLDFELFYPGLEGTVETGGHPDHEIAVRNYGDMTGPFFLMRLHFPDPGNDTFLPALRKALTRRGIINHQRASFGFNHISLDAIYPNSTDQVFRIALGTESPEQIALIKAAFEDVLGGPAYHETLEGIARGKAVMEQIKRVMDNAIAEKETRPELRTSSPEGFLSAGLKEARPELRSETAKEAPVPRAEMRPGQSLAPTLNVIEGMVGPEITARVTTVLPVVAAGDQIGAREELLRRMAQIYPGLREEAVEKLQAAAAAVGTEEIGTPAALEKLFEALADYMPETPGLSSPFSLYNHKVPGIPVLRVVVQRMGKDGPLARYVTASGMIVANSDRFNNRGYRTEKGDTAVLRAVRELTVIHDIDTRSGFHAAPGKILSSVHMPGFLYRWAQKSSWAKRLAARYASAKLFFLARLEGFFEGWIYHNYVLRDEYSHILGRRVYPLFAPFVFLRALVSAALFSDRAPRDDQSWIPVSEMDASDFWTFLANKQMLHTRFIEFGEREEAYKTYYPFLTRELEGLKNAMVPGYQGSIWELLQRMPNRDWPLHPAIPVEAARLLEVHRETAGEEGRLIRLIAVSLLVENGLWQGSSAQIVPALQQFVRHSPDLVQRVQLITDNFFGHPQPLQSRGWSSEYNRHFDTFVNELVTEDPQHTVLKFGILAGADSVPVFLQKYYEIVTKFGSIPHSPQTRVRAVPVFFKENGEPMSAAELEALFRDDSTLTPEKDYGILKDVQFRKVEDLTAAARKAYYGEGADKIPGLTLPEGDAARDTALLTAPSTGSSAAFAEAAGEARPGALYFDMVSERAKRWLVIAYLMYNEKHKDSTRIPTQVDAANRRFAEKVDHAVASKGAANPFAGQYVHGIRATLSQQMEDKYVNVDAVRYIVNQENLPTEALGLKSDRDYFPMNVDLSRLGEGATLADLVGESTSAGYGDVLILYDRDRLKNGDDGIFNPVSANRPTNPDHELVFMVLPRSFVNGIIVRDSRKAGETGPNAEALESIRQIVVEGGFYVPVFDIRGKNLFPPAEYDKRRREYERQLISERIVDKLDITGEQLGSNPGGATMFGGVRYYAKTSRTDENQLRLEYLADLFYRDLGIPTPDSLLVRIRNGALYRLSQWLEGENGKGNLSSRFIGDVLMANGDISANSGNFMQLPVGLTVAPDNGSAFFFRAGGKRKGTDRSLPFAGDNDNVKATVEMLEGAYFKGMSGEQKKAAIQEQLRILDERFTDEAINTRIDQVRYQSELDGETAEDLKLILKQRRDALFKYYEYTKKAAAATKFPSDFIKALQNPRAVAGGKTFDQVVAENIPAWSRIVGKRQHNGEVLSEHIQNGLVSLTGLDAEYGNMLNDKGEKTLALLALLFHDLGKPVSAAGTPAERDFDHAAVSAMIARDALSKTQWHLGTAFIEEVAWVVANHSFVTDRIRQDRFPHARAETVAQELVAQLPKGISAARADRMLRLLRAVNKGDVLVEVPGPFAAVESKFNNVFAFARNLAKRAELRAEEEEKKPEFTLKPVEGTSDVFTIEGEIPAGLPASSPAAIPAPITDRSVLDPEKVNKAGEEEIRAGRAPLGVYLPTPENNATLADFDRSADGQFVYVYRGLGDTTVEYVREDKSAHQSAAARDGKSKEDAYKVFGATPIDAVNYTMNFFVGGDATLHTTVRAEMARGSAANGVVVTYRIPVDWIVQENNRPAVARINTTEDEAAFYYGLPEEFVYRVDAAEDFKEQGPRGEMRAAA